MLKLIPDSIYLGEMSLREKRHFKFGLLNTSDKDIEIDSISTGCGSCTKTDTKGETVVKPGKTLFIYVDFTAISEGLVRKTITVNNSLVFTFSANVV